MSEYGIPFDYSPNDYKQCIEDTEKQLRNVIYNEMSKNFSTSWETDPKYGWIEDKIKGLIQRSRESIKTKHEKFRLIDFSDLLDLKIIIEKNQNVLSAIVPKKVAEWLGELNSLRVPSAHSRDLLTHQKSQIIGICGEILISIQENRIGKGSSTLYYTCELKIESAPKDVASEAMDAEVLGKKRVWLSKIKSIGTLESKGENDNEVEYLLRGNGGHSKIFLGKKIHLHSSSQQWKVINVKISSQNIQLLDKIIKQGSITVSVIYWIINNKIDVNALVKEIKQLTGYSPGSSGGIGGGIITSASYNFSGFDDSSISILLSTENSYGRLGLQRSGNPGKGFSTAHLNFNPDLLLSILYGKIPFQKRQQMFGDSF